MDFWLLFSRIWPSLLAALLIVLTVKIVVWLLGVFRKS